MFLNAAMRNYFQKYMRTLQWLSKTMIIAERVDIFLNAAMRNRFQKYMQTLQWFSKTMIIAERVDMFLNSAARNRFHKYMRAPQWLSTTMIIAERGWHFPQYRYAKSLWAVHASPCMTLESNDYS